jgi:hypothetical protein
MLTREEIQVNGHYFHHLTRQIYVLTTFHHTGERHGLLVNVTTGGRYIDAPVKLHNSSPLMVYEQKALGFEELDEWTRVPEAGTAIQYIRNTIKRKLLGGINKLFLMGLTFLIGYLSGTHQGYKQKEAEQNFGKGYQRWKL